ncbi:MAG TPA: hypothetical protein VFF98_10550 [Novosphingobium sp.]|nr:hypothetical protein [Novosphingobium sp.]
MTELTDSLPPLQRLALAYAPAPTRALWAALLALDGRLAGVVRQVGLAGKEPMIAQLRLAWWRDRLQEPAAQWPAGEPLLAALAGWQGQHGALAALVDGWEHLLAEAPLPAYAMTAWADGRAHAASGLAALLGADAQAAAALARAWSLADLAAHLSAPEEQAEARRLWQEAPLPPRAPRALRPLAVLGGLARREAAGTPARGVNGLILALRLGLWGA